MLLAGLGFVISIKAILAARSILAGGAPAIASLTVFPVSGCAVTACATPAAVATMKCATTITAVVARSSDAHSRTTTASTIAAPAADVPLEAPSVTAGTARLPGTAIATARTSVAAAAGAAAVATVPSRG